MRTLNLQQLKTLETVARTGGFTAAARELNLTQSAVSVQIRELETRLGVTLIERMGKQAFPTAAGRELLEAASGLFAQADEALRAMRRYREGWLGQVRLGASTTALIYHLPAALAKLRSEHPNIELHITTGNTAGICEQLVANQIDLGVVSLPIEGRELATTPLLTEPLFAIFPPRTKHVPNVVTPRDMLGHPLLIEAGRAHVKMMVLEWLTVDGVMPRPTMELDNLEAVVRMVEAGLGVSLAPESVVKDASHRAALLARPLKPSLSRHLALVQRRDKPATPALGHVRDAIMVLGRD